MLAEMKEGIEKLNQGNASLKERERLKAKISGLNSQLEALTERLSFYLKAYLLLLSFSKWRSLRL
jgi:hypothetical protein